MTGPVCTVCGSEAICRMSLPEGCQAVDAVVQDLCPQHLTSVTPVGDAEVVAVWRPDVYVQVVGL